MAIVKRIVYKLFTTKKYPKGFIGYCKNRYNQDGTPKLPLFKSKIHRLIACNGSNNDEVFAINSASLLKSHVDSLNKEFKTQYSLYINKKYLLMAFTFGNLNNLNSDLIMLINEYI